MISSTLSLYLIIFFILSFKIYFLVYLNRKKIGNKLGTNDIPDNYRKIHKDITPRTGSYSLAITLLIFLIFNIGFNFLDKDYNYIIIISLLSFSIGFLDDSFELNALKKIFFLTLISFLAITLSDNLIITKIYLKTFDTFFYLNEFSVFFTILCILLLTNAINLVDGINGIAVGLCFNFFFYLILIYQNTDLSIICCILLFNLLLIFYHNYKGKHFLGDAGTLMLSTMLSLLIIKINNLAIINPSHKFSAENIFIIFLIPGLDMLRLFINRLLIKKNPFTADKSHFHHYLLNRFKLRHTLLIYFLLVNIPIFLSYLNVYQQKYIILCTTIIFFILASILKNKKNIKN